jgi:hypothetical protein
MTTFARNIRSAIIVLGFLSSVAGTLGSFVLVENLSKQAKQLADAKNGAVRDIDKFGALANAYFIANQQGDLIYVLGLQDTSRKDLVKLIYQGNVLDRAEPVRNLIGALAIAHLLDFRKTYDAYEKLSDAARASQEYKDFLAVKAFERQVLDQAQDRVARLQLGLGELQQEQTRVESELRRRQLFILAFSVIGACLLLLANLLEQKFKSLDQVANGGGQRA